MKKLRQDQVTNRYRKLTLAVVFAALSSGLVAVGWSDRGPIAGKSIGTPIKNHPPSTKLGFFKPASVLTPAGSIISVNSTAQSPGASGDCTLGEAIQAANLDQAVDGCTAGSGTDTIVIPAGTYTLTNIAYSDAFWGVAGLPPVLSDIIFQGAGSDSTIIERGSTAPEFRLMFIGDGSVGSITLNDVTMRGARGDDMGGAVSSWYGRPMTFNRVVFENNHSARFGGAVSNHFSAVIVVNDCTFTNNEASGEGGAIHAGNLIVSHSTFSGNRAQVGGAFSGGGYGNFNINISDSVFTNNQTTDWGRGGAISYGGYATIVRSRFTGNTAAVGSTGGAIFSSGPLLNLFDSVVSGNQADSGGGLQLDNCWLNLNRSTIANNQATRHFGGGIYMNSSSLSANLSNSTISGNSAAIDGGGLWTSTVNVSVTNSTIDGNISQRYGGGIFSQAFFAPVTLALNNATMTSNHAGYQGGGILVFHSIITTSTSNSIIALNSAPSGCRDVSAAVPFTSLGYNLIGVDDCASVVTSIGDQVGTAASPIDPRLGPLQDNGGTTFTRALLSGSPALDAANPTEPGSGGDACAASDQRGVTRPRDGNDDGTARCDIGAHENIGTPSCAAPPAGMTAWWAFDGTAKDIVGDNHATLISGPTFITGKVEQALGFNGSDQHAVVPANAALDIGAGSGLTFDAWFNPSEVNTARPLIEWNSGSGAEGVHLWMSADFADGGQGPGSLFVNLRDTASQYHIFSSPPNLLLANQWQHVAVTYDKISGDAKIYLNGIVVAQQNLGSFTPQTGTDLYLGYRPAGVLAGRHFLGSLDEVELFNRALDASEVRAIYFADSAGKCKPGPTASPAVINVTEQIRVTDSPLLLLPAVIAVNENISVRDLTTLLPSAMIDVNERITVNDTPTFLLPAVIAVNESISVRDLPSLLPSAMIGVNERITVNDTPTFLLPAVIAVNENILVRDLPSLLPSAMIGVNERITVNDTPTFLLPAVIAVNENISVRDQSSLLRSAIIAVNEHVSVNDQPRLLLPAVIAVNETISVRDLPSLLRSVAITINERVAVRDMFGLLFTQGIVLLPTPTGSNVSVTGNNVSLTFENVSAAGTTTITQMGPASAGQLPGGYQLAGSGFAFEITTTAQYSGLIKICFSVPSITDPAVFNSLRVLHNENGTLVDRTTSQDFTTKTVCATVNSLSPFVIAQLLTGPRLLLQATVSDLKALRGTISDGRDRQKLDEIIKLLEDALNSSNWRDQAHLLPNSAEKVFGKFESAILKLRDLSTDRRSTVPPAVAQGFMKRLLESARALAQTAIIDAGSLNINQQEISMAIKALLAGDAKAASGSYSQALNDYREAWRRATNART